MLGKVQTNKLKYGLLPPINILDLFTRCWQHSTWIMENFKAKMCIAMLKYTCLKTLTQFFQGQQTLLQKMLPKFHFPHSRLLKRLQFALNCNEDNLYFRGRICHMKTWVVIRTKHHWTYIYQTTKLEIYCDDLIK